MNLVLLATDKDVHLYPALLVFLVIMREKKRTIYEQYIKAENSPDQAIEFLYSLAPKAIRLDNYVFALIEAFLIAAKKDRFGKIVGNAYRKHKRILDKSEYSETEKDYSRRVLEISEHAVESGNRVNLENLTKRIELIGQFRF